LYPCCIAGYCVWVTGISLVTVGFRIISFYNDIISLFSSLPKFLSHQMTLLD
jgi:hypothetical protein